MREKEYPITISEILVALSTALDLVEGQPEGHAARTCLIASKLAENLGLDEKDCNSVYFASLIKDAGCSSNAVRIYKIFGGDDLITKHGVKFIDWTNHFESLKFAFRNTERKQSLITKLRRMISNIGPPTKIMDEVTNARCTRGAEIARQLGFNEDVANAVYCLDEHWDGKGSPRHLSGQEIPVHARILCLAQTLEIFALTFGVESAMEMVKARRGKWFDPEVADVALMLSSDHDLWDKVLQYAASATVRLPISAAAQIATEQSIDQICHAFAQIIDAKSAFTGEHSTRVTEYSTQLASYFSLGEDRVTVIRRAALLHDIGKLGVSNAILEKPGALSEDEFDVIKLHPKNTYRILSKIRSFHRIAEVACAHHERLDGTGYWRGLEAYQLDLEMRIIAVADVFDALSAKRPYRDALSLDKVFMILDNESSKSLDENCVMGIKECYGNSTLSAA